MAKLWVRHGKVVGAVWLSYTVGEEWLSRRGGVAKPRVAA
jgi:hypothetical protein